VLPSTLISATANFCACGAVALMGALAGDSAAAAVIALRSTLAAARTRMLKWAPTTEKEGLARASPSIV